MNWWIIFQLYHWITAANTIPAYYQLTDEAFFAQPASCQLISLANPDTLLLDAALFHATNEARHHAGLPPLQYDLALYLAASSHAESMIKRKYYSHENLYSLADLTAAKRIRQRTDRFNWTAENIGQYQTIDTPEWFGVRRNARTGRYEYLDSETKQLYQPYSYADFARYAVRQWLASPHHRANLLNTAYSHVGCAGRLSPNPYVELHAPFGRLVQNFGANHGSAQASN
jgi:uncharacterized protein YkwD